MQTKFFSKILKIFLILNIFIVFVNASNSQDLTKNQIVVKFKSSKSQAEAKKIFSGANSASRKYYPGLDIHILSTPSKAQNQSIINRLKQRNDVEWAEVDGVGNSNISKRIFLTPNDPLYGTQNVNILNVENAWNITTGSSSLIVGIIDSGYRSTHEDLQANYVAGYHYTFAKDGLSGGSTEDVRGHGTAVAGSAGAIGNNSKGIAGPSWSSKLMPLRCTDSTGNCYWSDVAYLIDWGLTKGAKIFNLSFGDNTFVNSTWEVSILNDAYKKIIAANGAITISAGNQSTFRTDGNNPNMICVGALTIDGTTKADFSNSGYMVDVFAPGTVYTTDWASNTSYGSWGGTSFSSPLVSGVLALMKSANPNLTYTQMRRILLSTCTDMGDPGYDAVYAWGKVNAYAAVQAAQAGTINDTLNPGCYLISPANGSTLTGTITIDGRAMDNFDISKVELYVDGVLVKSLTKSTTPDVTYYTTLNTGSYANGSHTIYLKATDITGLTKNSGTITATFSNAGDTTAPSVTITNPKFGSTVSGTITATVTASDNISVVKVEYLLDNVLIATSTSSPFSTTINTSNYSNGSHTLLAKAYDAANNIGTNSITITINNLADTTAPFITITSPVSGAKIRKNTPVKVTATDNKAVVKVELYVDGILKQTSTLSPFTTTISYASLSTGSHSVYCKAYDSANNIGQSQTITIIK